jgi:hypothetical protein
MKKPKTDGGKTSLPGELKVVDINGIPTVFPVSADGIDMLQLVYNKGPVNVNWPLFKDLKVALTSNWMKAPKTANVISQQLRDKIDTTVKSNDEPRLALVKE